MNTISPAPSPAECSQASRLRSRWFLLCALAICVTVISLPMGMTAPQIESRQLSALTVPVERGTLEVTLAQRGLLDGAKNIIVNSECEWSVEIISLIPEGTWVEEGVVVMELDSSALVERLQQREIILINAKANLIEAQEVLKMQRLENESGRAKAALALELARLDLQKYKEGDFPKAEKQARAAHALAEEDRLRAHERYVYVARMARKGYESPMAVEKERLSLLRYEHKVGNARRAVDVLVNYTFDRRMTELRAKALDADRVMANVEKIATIAIINREVRVHTRQKSYDSHLAYEVRLRKNIEACTIRAPKDGEIIYANTGSIRDEIVEGKTVRNRQEVVRIPDLTQMDVNIRIHESLIDGIREKLPVDIRLDAYPDVQLTGHVHEVSRIPTSGSGFNYDLKEYDAKIRIDATAEELNGLMPGLTAQVDILVKRQVDCLHVPAQAVVEVAGRRVVFVQTPEGVEHREVELGMISDTSIEIRDGLMESEAVLLSPRTNCSEQMIALEDLFSGETDVATIGG